MQPTWNGGDTVKIGDKYRLLGTAIDDIRTVKNISFLIDGWQPETIVRVALPVYIVYGWIDCEKTELCTKEDLDEAYAEYNKIIVDDKYSKYDTFYLVEKTDDKVTVVHKYVKYV